MDGPRISVRPKPMYMCVYAYVYVCVYMKEGSEVWKLDTKVNLIETGALPGLSGWRSLGVWEDTDRSLMITCNL